MVTSSPKTAKNEVTKMGWNTQMSSEGTNEKKCGEEFPSSCSMKKGPKY